MAQGCGTLGARGRRGGRAIKKSSRMCMTPEMLSLWRIIPSKASENILKIEEGGASQPEGEYRIKKIEPFSLHA